MQLDVIHVDEMSAVCNLYADDRCVKVIMRADDYQSLLRDNFFVRDGKEQDDAGVWNTSEVYDQRKQ